MKKGQARRRKMRVKCVAPLLAIDLALNTFGDELIGFDRGGGASRKVSNGTRGHNSFMFVTGCHGSEI